MQKALAFTFQSACYPLLLIIRCLCIRRTIDPEIYRLRPGKYVVYANHQSGLDGQLLCICFPFLTMVRLMPFGYFVFNDYLHGPKGLLLRMAGCFPAHTDPGRPYGLARAKQLLLSRQTIVIFPQAMRTRKRIAMPGIARLAEDPRTTLIPLHIDWISRWRCHISIGKPFIGGEDLDAAQLMERVYELAAD